MGMWEDTYNQALDRGSLLEGSFINDATGQAVLAVDVSYVDGFTVPMVCECNNQVVLGCNLDLHEVCPDNLKVNEKTCANPYREQSGRPGDANIFKDCEKMAYTYPTDDEATKWNIPGCSRNLMCCIGTACKNHPGQVKCPGAVGQTQPCGGS
ncbi:uncharacterized protein F4822DRAFT_91835 [Hypoxylon trugodes]|uniref:uncharacterized protein n=1 Tax=Hypoxylon trugodes TaxID=326681 RepID=UPI00219C44E0|nr:uncharacterized protein F4822DRAFT_91835 [Hypoxylon trugodes]KAI1383073.1 hypothetical protein F4822DRAFT_91835 [Hypoxylon trugodes]